MYILDSGKTILSILDQQGLLSLNEPQNRPLFLPIDNVQKFKSGRYKMHLKDGRDLVFENGEMLLKSIMESAQAMEFVLFA